MYAQFKEQFAEWWEVSSSTYYLVIDVNGKGVWLEMENGETYVPADELNFSEIVDLKPERNSQEKENEIFCETHPNHPATQYFITAAH